MVVAFAAIGVLQLARRRWSDAVWTACAIGLPITTGHPGGIPRFFAVVYPAYFALAEATRNSPRARAALWTFSGLLLLACAARFVNWQWVAREVNPGEYGALYRTEDRHWWFAAVRRDIARAIERHAPAGERLRWLDAGSGTGGLLARLESERLGMRAGLE